MSLLTDALAFFGISTQRDPDPIPGEPIPGSTEKGARSTPENAQRYLYRRFWVDLDQRAAILDIRDMDRRDGRVKKIHGRTARAAVKGGLRLIWDGRENGRIERRWQEFVKKIHLDQVGKLESDARGILMEGNLALQWVLDADNRIAEAVRMPSETILPVVSSSGQFTDVQRAYVQHDILTGAELASFALWQLSMARLHPDNYDDHGSLGRPYLDATRPVWRKLSMTEEDLVIRRRHRAPLRMAHVLEGVTQDILQNYRDQIEDDQRDGDVKTDYYMNIKGSVTPIQGDANLDQIADVSYLIDTYFAGAPAPKNLFGYNENLPADILENLKRDYFEEIDALQDAITEAYSHGFCIDLLLTGINPDQYPFRVQFAERRTETLNQRADRALKLQAMGASTVTVFETAGLDPSVEEIRIEDERRKLEPFPDDSDIGAPDDDEPDVSITPGNAPMGESATTISNEGPARSRLTVATRNQDRQDRVA